MHIVQIETAQLQWEHIKPSTTGGPIYMNASSINLHKPASDPQIKPESRYHLNQENGRPSEVVWSPFVCRVKIALNLKGIQYENLEQDLTNKSPDLLKYNPIHKKVPVLLHNRQPICESLVILEYIEDVWKGVPILPQDPYEKSVARFWAKFIDLIPTVMKVFGSNGDEQVITEACEQLQLLENELAVDGKKFFGGDNINLVDIAASSIAYWLGLLEEATGIKIMKKDKFPKLTQWAENYVDCEVVKENLPPKEKLLAFFRKRFGNA